MTETGPPRLARLLALVPWLMRHDGVTITEAAAHFEVTREQMERDLWLLVCCGLPGHGPDQLIDIQFWDDDERIHVLDPQALAAPARLTAEEALSLQLGLRILADLPGGPDPDLMARTGEVLAGLSRQHLAELDRIITDRPGDPDVFAAVDQSLREGTALEITYWGATRDEVTTRVVHPERLIVAEGHTSLLAWCTVAREPRHFRLDRIRSATATRAAPPEAAAPDPTPPREGTLVEIAVAARARWLFDVYDLRPRDGIDPWSHDLEADGMIPASWAVWDREWLIRLVLGLAGDLVVIGPPEWRRAVHDAAQDALDAASMAEGIGSGQPGTGAETVSRG